ncbi:lasso peptide biosynthesis B2 protein [Isoptericola sp. S6320L]|uniref:lasso peptide biosynthesis B2 protein n=1 Tax=Isoptericola sp. S6320L TaxID=2926411 RepID=UPI001FF1AF5E|nr:lasso peptide biosynthesis B2 protein [Isoptericola sp. S6320L]MCK0117889.1 lasso peptide biosynthesis B2 protein [Isoptericola sp. S6320L]
MSPRRQVGGLLRAARSGLVYLVAETGLRTVGLRRTAAMLGLRLGGAPGTTPRAAFDTARLTAGELRRLRIDRRVLRLRWVNGTCLRTALVLGHSLRSRDPQIVLGVRRDDGGHIRAHAWLRIDGTDLDPEGAAWLYREFEQAQTTGGSA